MTKPQKFKTFKNKNLSERVANEIFQMILDKRLKGGEKLPSEPELAAQFGISRGILREALTIIGAKGYVRRTPGYGTFIRNLPEATRQNGDAVREFFKNASYNDILEIRASLEILCVKLVIARASDEELNNLEKDMQGLDKELSMVANFNFHLRLAELSKNIILINLVFSYSDLINELARDVYAIDDRYKKSIDEHFLILKAIKKRDLKTATKVMEHHLNEANIMLSKT